MRPRSKKRFVPGTDRLAEAKDHSLFLGSDGEKTGKEEDDDQADHDNPKNGKAAAESLRKRLRPSLVRIV
jgi:hypothetical protein